MSMTLWGNIRSWFIEVFTKKSSLPVGRQSIEQTNSIGNINTPLQSCFVLDWLYVLQSYSIFNADVSLAVDNIVNLANTEFQVTFGNVSSLQQKIMDKTISELNRKLRVSSLINSLIRQMAVNGALSAEIVIQGNLNGIDDVVLINPADIRFFYDNGKFHPYQYIFGKHIKLNSLTYSYIPLVQDNNNPYGIPPMLSALEGIGIERNLIKSFQKIAEKFGLFGFLEVLLTAPPRKHAETDEQYYRRCEDYIERVRPQVEKNISNGYVIGYKNSHEFKLTGGNTDASNAKEMMMLNDIVKMAGLKQDPNLLGRQQSRAETFGRVLLTIFTAKITTYQDIVAEFIKRIYETELLLKGFESFEVWVTFKKPVLVDEKLSQEAKKIQIENLEKLVSLGIITLEDMKRELNY